MKKMCPSSLQVCKTPSGPIESLRKPRLNPIESFNNLLKSFNLKSVSPKPHHLRLRWRLSGRLPLRRRLRQHLKNNVKPILRLLLCVYCCQSCCCQQATACIMAVLSLLLLLLLLRRIVLPSSLLLFSKYTHCCCQCRVLDYNRCYYVAATMTLLLLFGTIYYHYSATVSPAFASISISTVTTTIANMIILLVFVSILLTCFHCHEPFSYPYYHYFRKLCLGEPHSVVFA